MRIRSLLLGVGIGIAGVVNPVQAELAQPPERQLNWELELELYRKITVHDFTIKPGIYKLRQRTAETYEEGIDGGNAWELYLIVNDALELPVGTLPKGQYNIRGVGEDSIDEITRSWNFEKREWCGDFFGKIHDVVLGNGDRSVKTFITENNRFTRTWRYVGTEIREKVYGIIAKRREP